MSAMSKSDLGFTIGEVGISFAGSRLEEYPVPWGYQRFCGCACPQVSVHVHHAEPKVQLGSLVFACPPVWTLHRNNGTSALAVFQDPRYPGYARTLLYSEPLERTDLYLHEGTVPSNNLFAGPTLLLLMVNYLARKKGVMLHSCGVQRNGRGLLFVGDSGAGKSTLAGLLAQGEGLEVLSDERMILRKINEGFWIYGTPWHGDAHFASPLRGLLDGVCFLRQGPINELQRIPPLNTVSRLVQSSFIPHWDKAGMASTLDLFMDLASSVPCYLFTFSPDKTAFRFVQQHLL
jgi:hypothetical protein